MKEIIEELRKPPKPSGKTYIKGIIKEQKEYKKLDKSHKKKKEVKNMGRKKKIGSTWSRRNRTIKGKPRRIYVRKIEGKYQTRTHKPEIHGIALASKLMAQRPKKSQIRDKQRTHKRKISPTDKNLKSWKKRPGSADIKGNVDSKK